MSLAQSSSHTGGRRIPTATAVGRLSSLLIGVGCGASSSTQQAGHFPQ